MKAYISLMVLTFAALLVLLPSESAAQRKQYKGVDHGRYDTPVSWQGQTSRNRHRNRSWRYRGYKNYGQYRRTQVGNRRYTLARRYYWNDGRRLVRWVRVYRY